MKGHAEVTAVVMVDAPPATLDTAVAWVAAARWAAAADLVAQLALLPAIGRIIMATPAPAAQLPPGVTEHVATIPGPLHFGQTLAAIVEAYQIERLLYFGGGAAPLLPAAALAEVAARLAGADALVLTNNRYASDWAGVTPAGCLTSFSDRLPRDNMLGWVLSTEGGLPCETQPAGSGSRLDIDTPFELLVLARHPDTGPQLRRLLATLPLPLASLDRLLAILRAEGGRVFLAGRIGPEAWLALNRASNTWLRVLAEERGLVSSGRQARGEARSLLAAHIEAVGLTPFFAMLAEWSDIALLDSRVLLAHHGLWPAPADRFASDLGQTAAVSDPWLRTFTAAAVAAPLPVILGGHSLMAGALFAIAEMVQRRDDVT